MERNEDMSPAEEKTVERNSRAGSASIRAGD